MSRSFGDKRTEALFRDERVTHFEGIARAALHPGEILRDEFLAPLKLTAYRLAKNIGVPRARTAALLSGERAVTADTALRLGRFFGTSAEFWLGLQERYDLDVARNHRRPPGEGGSAAPAI
jgi:addiction module HigA family antidote